MVCYFSFDSYEILVVMKLMIIYFAYWLGIGNYLRAEILYRAGISPFTGGWCNIL
jgi:hypothetical protein